LSEGFSFVCLQHCINEDNCKKYQKSDGREKLKLSALGVVIEMLAVWLKVAHCFAFFQMSLTATQKYDKINL